MPDITAPLIEHAWRTVPSAVVLTIFVCTIAYVRSSQLKALIYSLPIPFSCAYLATRLPINATHLTGLIMVVGYNWAVFALHTKLRVPLLLAIAMSAISYTLGGMLLRPLWGTPLIYITAIALPLWLLNFWLYRPQRQPDHRGKTPVWLKAPLVFTIAMGMYNATHLIAGAVSTFPYAGVFTNYEMRHSLRTLAGQFGINSLGILLCMVSIAAVEAHVPPVIALLIGWLPVLLWAFIVHHFQIGRPVVDVEE